MSSNRSKMQPSKNDKISSAEDLAKTTKTFDVELEDKDLEWITGGKNIANIKWTPGTGSV